DPAPTPSHPQHHPQELPRSSNAGEAETDDVRARRCHGCLPDRFADAVPTSFGDPNVSTMASCEMALPPVGACSRVARRLLLMVYTQVKAASTPSGTDHPTGR